MFAQTHHELWENFDSRNGQIFIRQHPPFYLTALSYHLFEAQNRTKDDLFLSQIEMTEYEFIIRK